jgi:hypothetical protein
MYPQRFCKGVNLREPNAKCKMDILTKEMQELLNRITRYDIISVNEFMNDGTLYFSVWYWSDNP